MCKQHYLAAGLAGRLLLHPCMAFGGVLNFLQNLPSLLDCIFFDKMIHYS